MAFSSATPHVLAGRLRRPGILCEDEPHNFVHEAEEPKLQSQHGITSRITAQWQQHGDNHGEDVEIVAVLALMKTAMQLKNKTGNHVSKNHLEVHARGMMSRPRLHTMYSKTTIQRLRIPGERVPEISSRGRCRPTPSVHGKEDWDMKLAKMSGSLNLNLYPDMYLLNGVYYGI